MIRKVKGTILWSQLLIFFSDLFRQDCPMAMERQPAVGEKVPHIFSDRVKSLSFLTVGFTALLTLVPVFLENSRYRVLSSAQSDS